MNTKRKLRHDRQEDVDYQGGKFSDSEVGGKKQDQQNDQYQHGLAPGVSR